MGLPGRENRERRSRIKEQEKEERRPPGASNPTTQPAME